MHGFYSYGTFEISNNEDWVLLPDGTDLVHPWIQMNMRLRYLLNFVTESGLLGHKSRSCVRSVGYQISIIQSHWGIVCSQPGPTFPLALGQLSVTFPGTQRFSHHVAIAFSFRTLGTL